MDFVIVVIGAIGAILELSGSATMQAARSMRSFRALRPMRMAARADGMRIVIEALFQAIPPIMNVALVYPVLPHLRHPGAELVHG